MKRFHAGLLLSAGLLSGCGSGDPAAGTTGTGGSHGTGGAPTTLSPSLFDCSAPIPPERVNTVPIECATDPACPTRLVTGHRGVGGELGVLAPEDTLAAVRAAIALGVDYIETDPRATKDGVLVNMHDPDVDRTTDGTGDVASLTLAEIQALHVEASEYPGDFSCERVPTIEQVLAAARGKVHVLLDANKTDRIDLLVEAIQKTDTREWAILDTDSVTKLDEALLLDSSLHIMIRVASEVELADELAHFAAHPPVIVEVHDTGQIGPIVSAIQSAGSRAFTNVFVTDIAAGLDGDVSLYGGTYDQGFAIVQTDRPELVLEYLGRWPQSP